MRAVAQRVTKARCRVEGEVIGKINHGLLVFLGVGQNDEEPDAEYLVQKLVGLRVFPDDQGKMDLSLSEVSGGLLVIPQFTLYGDVRRGLRPSFDDAAPPERARRLYQHFLDLAHESHDPVQSGEFGAMMDIEAENDGPVTVLVDSDELF